MGITIETAVTVTEEDVAAAIAEGALSLDQIVRRLDDAGAVNLPRAAAPPRDPEGALRARIRRAVVRAQIRRDEGRSARRCGQPSY